MLITAFALLLSDFIVTSGISATAGDLKVAMAIRIKKSVITNNTRGVFVFCVTLFAYA